MYATDMGLPVAYRPLVRLRCDAPNSPNPPYQCSMACVLSVRHGYGRSSGVHFSCTPPLRSCGVQNFVYASDEHSSYDLFPSSVKNGQKLKLGDAHAPQEISKRYKHQSLGMPPRHPFSIGKNQVTFQYTIFLLLHALCVFLGASVVLVFSLV
jgi:hypothetical protein